MAEIIMMHEYTLSMVDILGFRRLVTGLNHDFRMISPKTLRSDILKMFDDRKSCLKKLLEAKKGKITVTTDM